MGYMEVSYELGLARFSGIEGTTEYTEAWELFIQRLQKQIEQVRACLLYTSRLICNAFCIISRFYCVFCRLLTYFLTFAILSPKAS